MLEKLSLPAIAGEQMQAGTLADVARIEGVAVRVACLKGAFAFHAHDGEDELLNVLDGTTTLETQQGGIALSAGDAVLVPAGQRHRTVTSDRATVLFVHPDRIRLPGAAVPVA